MFVFLILLKIYRSFECNKLLWYKLIIMTTGPISSAASAVRDLLCYANSLNETHSSFDIGGAGVEATSGSAATRYLDTYHDGRECCTKGIHSDMSCEVDRLATFKNWPRESTMTPSTLTRAGFFYTGSGDMVKCFSCNGKIEDWEFGDSAIGEHKRFFPNCKFVREKYMQNQLLWNQGASGGPPNRPSDRLASEYFRVLTFLPWPHLSPIERPCPIQAQALARAGFYYVQTKDIVRCFACMGEISNWECVDIPMVQHKNMFPGCPFVRGEDIGNERLTTVNVINIQQALIYQEPATKLPQQENENPNHVGQLRQTAKLTDEWPYLISNPLVRAQRHPLCINSSVHSSEAG
ncbi:baculoviral IAP repeat-containing protein 2-like, partial [Anneissia japonica]|uniref:baculoviral IAP repeat-containing protein 2-like n=1 Tax=Anneissia japonica TaxID=1529436 RepID=UPI0014257D92